MQYLYVRLNVFGLLLFMSRSVNARYGAAKHQVILFIAWVGLNPSPPNPPFKAMLYKHL